MRNLIALVAFFVICLPLSILAQNKNGSIHVPDTLYAPYIRITGVEITGNKLTKARIIERELDFNIGDSLATYQKGERGNFSDRNFYPGDSSELRMRMNYSRENLINTKLFLAVDISLKKIHDNQYTLLIDVTERHYWWLFPVAKMVKAENATGENAPYFAWLQQSPCLPSSLTQWEKPACLQQIP